MVQANSTDVPASEINCDATAIEFLVQVSKTFASLETRFLRVAMNVQADAIARALAHLPMQRRTICIRRPLKSNNDRHTMSEEQELLHPVGNRNGKQERNVASGSCDQTRTIRMAQKHMRKLHKLKQVCGSAESELKKAARRFGARTFLDRKVRRLYAY